jgi:hypothetical protein
VPETADLQENPEDRYFKGLALRSPLLETLRGALAADDRWTLLRVSSLSPDMYGKQPLLVWVTSHPPREEARTAVRTGVCEHVTDVIPDALLLRIEDET